MTKLKGLRKNLLVFLIAAVALPVACRELVMMMVRTNAQYGTQDSLHGSGRLCFGKRLLSQINCQSLQTREKTAKSKPCAFSFFSPMSVPVVRVTAKAVPSVLGEERFPSAGPIPLRI